jgi:hypothetical protein
MTISIRHHRHVHANQGAKAAAGKRLAVTSRRVQNQVAVNQVGAANQDANIRDVRTQLEVILPDPKLGVAMAVAANLHGEKHCPIHPIVGRGPQVTRNQAKAVVEDVEANVNRCRCRKMKLDRANLGRVNLGPDGKHLLGLPKLTLSKTNCCSMTMCPRRPWTPTQNPKNRPHGLDVDADGADAAVQGEIATKKLRLGVSPYPRMLTTWTWTMNRFLRRSLTPTWSKKFRWMMTTRMMKRLNEFVAADEGDEAVAVRAVANQLAGTALALKDHVRKAPEASRAHGLSRSRTSSSST